MPKCSKACVVQAIIDYKDEGDLWEKGKKDAATKGRLVSALRRLYASGFRSLMIYIGNPTDFWLAETIWEMSETAESPDISYSLVFITSFVKMQDKWIDREKHWKEITDKAKQVFWQKSVFPHETAEPVLTNLSGERCVILRK